MSSATTSIGLLLVLVLANPGLALHCNGDITTIGTGAVILYMDDRNDAPGDVGHWVYLEDNGVQGLQSGDDDPWFPRDTFPLINEYCHHREPDSLLHI